ncbi:MAG: phytanoyl-CoA dioxygenase family protein [Burkholderiaceae bacterium]|nr:phytanoyl-CoA dioxygenase family protein [Burkholderiaceae bacterium]
MNQTRSNQAIVRTISEDDVDAYQRDGVVVLRGVFAEWVEPLAAGVEKLMADPSPRERSVVPADGTAPFFQDLVNWDRFDEFRQYVFDSPAAAIAAKLMRSRSARFFHDHVLVKRPGGSTVTPWHQDQPYYCVEGSQSVSFWTPLDPVARDVAMECIRGSHRWDKRYTPQRFDGTSLNEIDHFDALPDLEAQRNELDIAVWALEPGDAIAFDFRTLHRAPANHSTRLRRVFSARWVGDDAVYVRRSGKVSPPIRDLGIPDGAPFDAPEFPVAWPAR